MLDLENNYINYNVIAGIDEAGRGCLAGPVAVAICIMPMENRIEKINDSKKLSPKIRDILYDEIIANAIDYDVELIDEKIIDDINILNATKLGMKKCLENIKTKPDITLIDAVKIDGFNTDSIIHGDALSYNIAAASILAKVTRDRYMCEMSHKYPEYDFAKHKGYGTSLHLNKLREFGRCEIHRNTFLKNFPEIR